MEKKYGVSLNKLEELIIFQKRYRKALRMCKINGINIILKQNQEVKYFASECCLQFNKEDINIKTDLFEMTIQGIQISAYNIVEAMFKIIILLKPESMYEECILECGEKDKLTRARNWLPKIKPTNCDVENSSFGSSDTDFNDSGEGKTIHISDTEDI